MSEELALLILLPAGFIAGFINTLAGGGSFLTLPALLALGMPLQIANGTNRVAIAFQAVAATAAYKKGGHLDVQLVRRLLPPVLVGALLGAYLATVIDPNRLRQSFGLLFLLMAVVLVAGRRLARRAKSAGRELKAHPLLRHPLTRLSAFFVIGIYAGFIQAGVGLWIVLGATALHGVDALRANTLKLPLVLVLTLPAVAIFFAAGQVRWVPGLVLAAGNVAGTLTGVRMSIRGGPGLILSAVTAVLVVTGVALLAT